MARVPHLARSRIEKVMTDAPDGGRGFMEAEAVLDNVGVAVVLGAAEARSAAGQAAALTILNTAIKCFGRAQLAAADAGLHAQLMLGKTLHEAAHSVGADVGEAFGRRATHVIAVGCVENADPFVRCWWNGWNSGIRPGWDDEALGDPANPLSGVFAGALAIREVFANAIGRRRSINRTTTVNLWQPWATTSPADSPPVTVASPNKLWFVGLGHLGQGFLWNLAFLPAARGHAVLQDNQTVGEENVATGLVTLAEDVSNATKKARVAARWLEAAGWTTTLIERRNYGDLRLTPEDPAVILTSIDEPLARVEIAKAGHDFLIDAGVGHGAFDFEIGQIRVVPKAVDASALWSTPEKSKNVDQLLNRPAYQEHAIRFDSCGTFELAEASVAVPFVGAAIGSLAIAQLLRLASLQTTPQIMQVELAAPDSARTGIFNASLEQGLGGTEFEIASAPLRLEPS